MQIREIGEFGLIDIIKKDTVYNPQGVVQGIGDDAAVLSPRANWLELMTTDMLVENVHFNLATTTLWQLGYKALAVNISDIAAMGGLPRHALISLGLKKDMTVEDVAGIYDGMKAICREFGVNIVGGDTVSSPAALVINAVLVGTVEKESLVRRSGARLGDCVAVTGYLGNSGAGLELLQSGSWQSNPCARKLAEAHLVPCPQVRAGRAAAACGATSMDDISDGLASEANEIASASKVGITIYEDRIPLAPELLQAATLLKRPPVEYALYGGEDFQLIFTIPPGMLPLLQQHAGDASITVIGEVTGREPGVTLVRTGGQPVLLAPAGYNHFR